MNKLAFSILMASICLMIIFATHCIIYLFASKPFEDYFGGTVKQPNEIYFFIELGLMLTFAWVYESIKEKK